MIYRKINRVYKYSSCFLFLATLQCIIIVQLLKDGNQRIATARHTKSKCINKTLIRLNIGEIKDDCTTKHEPYERFAYVFYITKNMKKYECYLYVLLHQLQVKFSRPCYVDYVIIHEEGYVFKNHLHQFKNIRLLGFENFGVLDNLQSNGYYSKSYVKLKAFSLYNDYDKILFLDIDAVLLKDPYSLFKVDLGPHQVGASYCNWYFPKKWLTSSIFVARLTSSLNEKLNKIVKRKDLKKILKNHNEILDMEIFNILLEFGNKTKILKHLINLDSHYIDPIYIARFYDKSRLPYYVHFSHMKPHLNERFSTCLEDKKIKAKPEFFYIYRLFWQYYYMYC